MGRWSTLRLVCKGRRAVGGGKQGVFIVAGILDGDNVGFFTGLHKEETMSRSQGKIFAYDAAHDLLDRPMIIDLVV